MKSTPYPSPEIELILLSLNDIMKASGEIDEDNGDNDIGWV